MIDLTQELVAALGSPQAKECINRIVREAVRDQMIETANAAPPDGLVDVRGAAKLLDMSPAAVRKSVERGRISCQRIGRALRFRRSDLLVLVNSR